MLLDRSEYRVQLTSEGSRINELANQLLTKHEEINNLADSLHAGEEAFIRIAVEASFNMEHVISPLKMLQSEHNNCQIMLEEEYFIGRV